MNDDGRDPAVLSLPCRCPTSKMTEYVEDESMRQVIIYPGEDGWWVAECPSLPGCLSQGKSKDEAITNIREAIRGYVAALEEDRIPIPEEHFDAMLLAV